MRELYRGENTETKDNNFSATVFNSLRLNCIQILRKKCTLLDRKKRGKEHKNSALKDKFLRVNKIKNNVELLLSFAWLVLFQISSKKVTIFPHTDRPYPCRIAERM